MAVDEEKLKQVCIEYFQTNPDSRYSYKQVEVSYRESMENSDVYVSSSDVSKLARYLPYFAGKPGLIFINGAAYSGKTILADSIAKDLANHKILVHKIHTSKSYESFEKETEYSKYFYSESNSELDSILRDTAQANVPVVIIDEARDTLPAELFNLIATGTLVIIVLPLNHEPERLFRTFAEIHYHIISRDDIERYYKGILTVNRYSSNEKIITYIPAEGAPYI